MKTIKVILDGKEVEETILEEDEFEINEDIEDLEDTMNLEELLKGEESHG